MLQLAWAARLAASRPSEGVLVAGALGNLGLGFVWLVSRTRGLPFVPGAEHREPVGAKDAVTTLLEVLVVAGVVVLLSWEARPALARARIPAHALAPLAVATLVIAVPGVVLPAHHHAGHDGNGTEVGHLTAHDADASGAHGHTETDAGHVEHADDAHLASAHVHAAPGDTEPAAGIAPPTPRPDAGGIAASVRYGPFVAPPASLGGERHENKVLTGIPKPCTDCYIVAARPDLVYEDGSHANLDSGLMLHHAVWTRPSFRDTTCGRDSGIGSQGLRFFAAGNERTEFRLPAGFGYHVGADPWNLIAEIMNHSDVARTVYVTLDVLYRPASDQLLGVTPVWLDVDNCADSEYAVPAGSSEQHWSWTSTLTGRIVSTGGHVHDGGVKTVLLNESTGERMCTSVAGYGTKPAFNGTVESMSTCVWDSLGVLRTGDELAIRAYYDSSVAQDDVMGIMVALVYETDDLGGGSAPPPSDPPPDPDPPPVHDH